MAVSLLIKRNKITTKLRLNSNKKESFLIPLCGVGVFFKKNESNLIGQIIITEFCFSINLSTYPDAVMVLIYLLTLFSNLFK